MYLDGSTAETYFSHWFGMATGLGPLMGAYGAGVPLAFCQFEHWDRLFGGGHTHMYSSPVEGSHKGPLGSEAMQPQSHCLHSLKKGMEIEREV